MSTREPSFDPEALAEWLVHGLKETIAYRLKKDFTVEKLLESLRLRIPTRNQVAHQLLKKGFENDGYQFEEIRQGDSRFHLIRKKIRDGNRRLIMIPGFGDSPGSWLMSFSLCRRTLQKYFDEIIILDFPGYLGFLSHQPLTPSMSILQSVVKTVCDANPPHTLIGHSLGGWLAGKYAQQRLDGAQASNSHLERIHHLILIAPSGLTPIVEREAFAKSILDGQKFSLAELLSRMVYDPKPYLLLMKEEFRQFYAKPEIAEFIRSVKDDEFLNEHLPFATDRFAIIWGDHDRFVPTQWMRHWIEFYGPYTDAYLIKNSGHLPQIEHPRALSEIILQCLQITREREATGAWTKIQSSKLSFNSALKLPSSRLIK